MTPEAQLASALLNLAKLMKRVSPTDAELAHGAYLILAESQAMLALDRFPLAAEVSQEADLKTADTNARRFAALWLDLQDSDDRMNVIRLRTGWSRSTYFRVRQRAKKLHLID